MSRISRFLLTYSDDAVLFQCPACKTPHAVWISGPNAWGYNGNPDAPTFTPSIKVTYNGRDADSGDAPAACCHSFVTDGHIRFESDCSHAMAGQTAPLPEIDDKWL